MGLAAFECPLFGNESPVAKPLLKQTAKCGVTNAQSINNFSGSQIKTYAGLRILKLPAQCGNGRTNPTYPDFYRTFANSLRIVEAHVLLSFYRYLAVAIRSDLLPYGDAG